MRLLVLEHGLYVRHPREPRLNDAVVIELERDRDLSLRELRRALHLVEAAIAVRLRHCVLRASNAQRVSHQRLTERLLNVGASDPVAGCATELDLRNGRGLRLGRGAGRGLRIATIAGDCAERECCTGDRAAGRAESE